MADRLRGESIEALHDYSAYRLKSGYALKKLLRRAVWTVQFSPSADSALDQLDSKCQKQMIVCEAPRGMRNCNHE
jgi:hypothetical protein